MVQGFERSEVQGFRFLLLERRVTEVTLGLGPHVEVSENRGP